MKKFQFPKLDRERLGLTNHVSYAKYDPSAEVSTGARKSLAHLDYSPLPRVTRLSFTMGVLVSMGGFLYVIRCCLILKIN